MEKQKSLKDSQDHKQKVKDVLRNAICLLCQNTVIHHAQLSIEAVIGITVDNGDDMLIISIQELLGKDSDSVLSNVGHSTSAINAKNMAPPANTECTEDEVYECEPTDYGSADFVEDNYPEDYGQTSDYVNQYEQNSHYGTIVKKESTSVITYNVGASKVSTRDPGMVIKQETFPETTNRFGRQPFGDGVTLGIPYYGPGHSKSSFKLSQRNWAAAKSAQGILRKAKSGLVGRQKISSTEITESHKSGGPRTEGGSEVECIMLYTCARCGAQMRNKSSFKRHKQSHEGVVYRCDGCGKVISRADNLLVHRRRCAAALKQQQIMMNGLEFNIG